MAFSFNGSSQSLTTASTPVTDVPITLSTLYYPRRNTANEYFFNVCPDDGTGETLVCLQNDGTAAGDPLRVVYRGATGGSAVNAQATATPTQNAWQGAAGVFLSSSSRTVYLAGGNSATNTTANAAAAGERISIGALFRGTAALWLDGLMAETAIWNVALTDAEVASLAKGFKPTRIRPQSLVFYAPLIRTIQDLRGALSITNNNSATVADHPRVY